LIKLCPGASATSSKPDFLLSLPVARNEILILFILLNKAKNLPQDENSRHLVDFGCFSASVPSRRGLFA
jgi:hypothetical protein